MLVLQFRNLWFWRGCHLCGGTTTVRVLRLPAVSTNFSHLYQSAGQCCIQQKGSPSATRYIRGAQIERAPQGKWFDAMCLALRIELRFTIYRFVILIVKQKVLGVILGGGAGTRLYPLTKARAKPAVPLGANYRLIDIPISNCLNSSINKIYVLTQFNSASLNRHIVSAYVSEKYT